MSAEGRRRLLLPGTDHSQDGQMIVLFALALVAIIFVAGLAVDAGVAFMGRRGAQNVSDLSAMAGTKRIMDFYVKGTATTNADVWNSINTSVISNGCTPSGPNPCTWTAEYVDNVPSDITAVTNDAGSIPAAAQGVRVDVSLSERTYFLSAVGQSSWRIATTATGLTSAYTSTAGLGQLLPIGVAPPNQSYTAGQIIDVTVGMNGPGNFGWLSWDGSNGTPTLIDSLCTPDNPALTFPVWIAGDPGKKNSSGVRSCLQYWVDNQATVLLPLWDVTNGKGGNNLEYHVTGLIAVQLVSYSQPAVDEIQARVIDYYQGSSIGANYGGPPCNPDLQSCTQKSTFIGLIR